MTDNPNMVGVLKQLREMQKDLATAQKELEKETVSAEAGNGAVSVTITGDQKITKLTIDADLLASNDAKKITSLTMEAVNKALEESRKMAQDRLGPLANSISL